MDHDSQPYWEACNRKVLTASHCQECGRWFWYPRAICPRCLSSDVRLDPVAGTGTLYTYVRRHKKGKPEPYTVAWVQLDEDEELIVAAGTEGPVPEIGGRMSVDWAPWKDGFTPVFVAAEPPPPVSRG